MDNIVRREKILGFQIQDGIVPDIIVLKLKCHDQVDQGNRGTQDQDPLDSPQPSGSLFESIVAFIRGNCIKQQYDKRQYKRNIKQQTTDLCNHKTTDN